MHVFSSSLHLTGVLDKTVEVTYGWEAMHLVVGTTLTCSRLLTVHTASLDQEHVM